MVMNPLLVHYFILLNNAFFRTVHPMLSYAVEKFESMLEAADVLKSSGKELLSLVPREFMETTNKIQNAIYWLNASLKALSPCHGHVTEIPVSDFDVPQFGEPVSPSSSRSNHFYRSSKMYHCLPPCTPSALLLLLQLGVLSNK